MTEHVSEKIAHKLKNNGIFIKSTYWYNTNGVKLKKHISPEEGDTVDIDDILYHNITVQHVECPTISDVVAYIYKNFNIYIWVSCRIKEDDINNVIFIPNGRYIPSKIRNGFEIDRSKNIIKTYNV